MRIYPAVRREVLALEQRPWQRLEHLRAAVAQLSVARASEDALPRLSAASGGFRAHIKDQNHKLIFWTQVYTTKANAKHACELVQMGARTAPIYDRT